MMTVGHRSHDHFASTRWSMVLRPDAQSSAARGALSELAQRYWHPVYAYIRCSGNDPESAREVARGFLSRLLEPGTDEPLSARGRFRRYLLARLKDFLAADWRQELEDRSADDLTTPPDLEVRYQRYNANAASPEQAYQRSFAIEVIARALQRLRSEAQGAGHLDMYDVLQPYLDSDPPPRRFEELARELQTSPLVVIVTLRRLRQRFRDLVSGESADTVSSVEDLAAELDALHAVLLYLPP